MFKILEYKLVRNGDLKLFTEDVNKLIKEGWQPLGSVGVAGVGGTVFQAQAMVKYGEKIEYLLPK
jgi:hypothetical protein